MAVVITGCSTKQQSYEVYKYNHSIYNPETDYQYYLHQQMYNQRITETDNGYYMINGNYIYYIDKATMEPILLDNNPNNDCSPVSAKHQVSNCNAYIELGGAEYRGLITYYKDELYIVAGGISTEKDTFGEIKYELIKMKKDGSSRKTLKEFDYIPKSIAIHRDTVYFNSIGQNDKDITVEQVVSVPLDAPNSEPKVLYTVEYNDLHLNDIIPYGTNVYFTESGRNMYRTVQYNIELEKAEILFKDHVGNITIDSRIGDKMFFANFTGDARDKRSWKKYESNMDGEEISELPLHLNTLSHVYTDSNYLYQAPVLWYTHNEDFEDIFSSIKDELLIYDWSYKQVYKVQIPYETRSYGFVNGNDQHIFLRTENSETEKIYYLDKSEISSKKAIFKLLIETAVR